MNNKHLLILGIVIVVAFLIHASPSFILPRNQYNFYDTDSWNFIQGDDYSTSDIFPRIISLFPGSPLDVFNTAGYLAPILSTIFTIMIYILVSRLFNEQVGFYAAAMMAVGVGIFFQNTVFGFVDHHLLQAILFICCILSILLISKNKWYCTIATFSGVALYFVSPVIWLIYYGIIAGVIWITALGFVVDKQTKWFVGFILLTCIGIGILFYILPSGAFGLWGWSEPISEIAPPNILLLLMHYNTVLIPVVIGMILLLFSKFNAVETALVAATVVTFILTLRFYRMELLLVPLVVILAAIYIDKYLMRVNRYKNLGEIILCIFILTSVGFGCLVVSEIVTISHHNERFNGAIQFLGEQPSGMVLTWWDYGSWLQLSGQPVYTDNGQLHATEAARVFTDKIFPKEPISYILVTDEDLKFYTAMQYYSGSDVTYENSYLYALVNGNEPGLVYNKEGIKIYNRGINV